MIDVLCDYLDTLGSGKRRVATQADYGIEQAKRGRAWPAKATFGRFPPEGSTVSGFTSWIAAAEAERQKRQKAASKPRSRKPTTGLLCHSSNNRGHRGQKAHAVAMCE